LDAPARGGIETDELRRVQQRAERFIADQAAGADMAMARQQEQERAAQLHQAETMEARAWIARAQTLRSEGNSKMALGVAGGVALGLLFGFVLVGGRHR
jgi:hypothetical protein